MRARSTSRIGGIGALSVTIFTGFFLIALILASRLPLAPDEIAWPHVLADYALALIGLSGLAAVPAISARVVRFDPELIRWSSTVAQFGFGLLAVVSFWQAEYETSLAVDSMHVPALGYDGAASAAGESFIQTLLMRLPMGWLEVAGVGIWMLSVSWVARKKNVFPAGLVRLGLAAGLSAILVPLGATLQLTSLLSFTLLLYTVALGPFWFIWMGSLLLDEVVTATPAPKPRGAVPAVSRPPRRYAIGPTLRRLAHRMPSLN